MTNGDSPKDDDIAAMPFEKAMTELEVIVQRLERGDVALDDSISLYERGERLRQRCEALLKSAEMRVEAISLGANGTPTGIRPLDADSA